MLDGILGRKLGMTQIFEESGKLVPVTVIEAGPCFVTQIKTPETDGYSGVQVAFEAIKPSKANKPRKGLFKKVGIEPQRKMRELPVTEVSDLEVGQQFRSDVFAPGDKVKVTGVSKGKGFAGAMKKYHFHGGEASHGSTVKRKPQSGGATDAARTFKGSRRPGHMGAVQVTQRGLTVYRVDPDRNLLLIKGAIPGANGGLVMVARQNAGG